MDPWQNSTVGLGLPTEPIKSVENLNFEDNFTPRPTPSTTSSDLLPDSAEYLARLERKLNKLKMGKGSAKSLVESLSAIRESHMIQLLSNEESIPKELNEEIVINRTQELIMRRFAPEKQAISLEELVELLKADQLAQDVEKDQLAEEDEKDLPPVAQDDEIDS